MWIRGNFIIQALFSNGARGDRPPFLNVLEVRFGEVLRALFSIVGTANLVLLFFSKEF